jgi:hypothetical protein
LLAFHAIVAFLDFVSEIPNSISRDYYHAYELLSFNNILSLEMKKYPFSISFNNIWLRISN